MNKRILFVMIALLYQISFGRATNLYQKSLQSLHLKDSVEALMGFQNCLNYESCNDSSFYFLAILQKSLNRNQDNYMQNIELFLEKGHDNSRLTMELAEYSLQKNRRKTEVHLKKLLPDPDFRSEAATHLMKFYYKNFMTDSLIKYQEVLAGDYSPNQTLLKQNLRRALKKENIKRIKTFGNLVLQQDQEDPLGHYALSIVNFKNKKYSLAFAHALKAGEMQKNYDYYRPRLHALYKYKRWNKIHQEAGIYKNDLKKSPDELSMYVKALLELGIEDEAAKLLVSLNKESISKSFDLLEIAMVFYRQGLYENSKQILQGFDQKNQTQMDIVYGALADIARLQDSLFEARDYYEKAFTQKENRGHRMNYIEMCEALGQILQAKSSVEFLEKEDPQNTVLLKYLHKIYRSLNDQENLIHVLERRVKIEYNNNALKLELARIYVMNSKWKLAEPLLAELYDTYEDYSSGELYSKVLIRNGKYIDSLEVCEKLFHTSGEDMHILQRILSIPDPHLSKEKRIYYTKMKLDKEPNNLALRKAYVKLTSETKGSEEYSKALVGLYDKTPSDTKVLTKIVDELSQTKHKTLTINYLNDLIKQDDSFQNLKMLADLYLQKGQKEKSLQYYLKAYEKSDDGKLSQKVFYQMKQLKGDKVALDFLLKHCNRFENDHEARLIISQEIEFNNRKGALKFAEKAYQIKETQENAFQYSKLKLLLSEKDQSKVKPPLPWNKYDYAKDSLILLQGLSHYNSGNFSEASVELSKVNNSGLARSSRSAHLFSLQQIKNWEKINNICENLNTTSLLLSEFYACGEGLWRVGKYVELEGLSKEHQAHNDVGNINITYQGLAKFAQGEYAEIDELFGNLEPIEKFKNESYWAHGFSLYKMSRFKEADQVWQKGEKYLSHWDSLYFYRSQSLIAQGDYKGASRVLDKGLKKHPLSIPLYQQQIQVAGILQNKNDVYVQSKSLAKVDPQNLTNNIRLGQFYMERNYPQKVVELFKGKNLNNNIDALMLVAEASFKLKDYPRVIENSKLALELNRRHSRAYFLISRAHEADGNFSESQEYFHKYSDFAGKD